jgi:acyl-CoA synthetase (AMP-forming)/AMP-acid ligase II/thioesterase domain-containing protein/acyl carrier protein
LAKSGRAAASEEWPEFPPAWKKILMPRKEGYSAEDSAFMARVPDSRTQIPILWKLIGEPRVENAGSPAILAPGRKPLSYGRLARIVRENLRNLREAGIGARDRVAVVLPNGPEMAVSLLAVMVAGAAAPLNPDYSDAEFDFYLGDAEPKALLIQAGMNNPSREVAGARKIPVIELYPEDRAEAGSFRVACPAVGPPSHDHLPQPDDIALLLHTSGTTSKPKLVPLTQSNLYFSALNIKESLRLSPEDRCLNVMPLFHVHGLVASLLASLAAGGSLVCAPAFLANEFFGWMRDYSPTWYTAVPTIHQAVLARGPDFSNALKTHRLRFIRSCSASLSPSLMSGLEGLFRIPVVEAYGMTEASHQMASNPLPPRPRKAGSVGLPTGVEMAILDEAGTPVPNGQTGEVGVRGPTVTLGYLKNHEANAKTFSEGWLRTGDIGHFDADGYLYLKGRLKEMINRGGEKISPREVEDVLLTHPEIALAVAFAVPNERLGEDVAAAVVPRAGAKTDENEIRAFVARKLAYFKVPRRVIFVDEIPKGSTGKLQRLGLAQKLGLSAGTQLQTKLQKTGMEHLAKTSDKEERILRLMRKFLAGERFGAADNFFEAGGDSLQAAAFLAEVERHFDVDIPISKFILNATARHLAGVIEGAIGPALRALVPIKRSGARPPFFCVHPHDGRVALFYRLADYLEEDQPLYAFQTLPGEDMRPAPGGIENLAKKYIEAMQAFQPDGPYLIGGYCFGALVAFEMSRILSRQRKEVAFLALIDSYAPGCPVPSVRGLAQGLLFSFIDRARRIRPFLAYISRFPANLRKQYLLNLVRTQVRELCFITGGIKAPGPSSYSLPGQEDDRDWQYRPGSYSGSAVLFRPTREPLGFRTDPAMGWSQLVGGRLDIERISGYHRSLIFQPRVRTLAERLSLRLRQAQPST